MRSMKRVPIQGFNYIGAKANFVFDLCHYLM